MYICDECLKAERTENIKKISPHRKVFIKNQNDENIRVYAKQISKAIPNNFINAFNPYTEFVYYFNIPQNQDLITDYFTGDYLDIYQFSDEYFRNFKLIRFPEWIKIKTQILNQMYSYFQFNLDEKSQKNRCIIEYANRYSSNNILINIPIPITDTIYDYKIKVEGEIVVSFENAYYKNIDDCFIWNLPYYGKDLTNEYGARLDYYSSFGKYNVVKNIDGQYLVLPFYILDENTNQYFINDFFKTNTLLKYYPLNYYEHEADFENGKISIPYNEIKKFRKRTEVKIIDTLTNQEFVLNDGEYDEETDSGNYWCNKVFHFEYIFDRTKLIEKDINGHLQMNYNYFYFGNKKRSEFSLYNSCDWTQIGKIKTNDSNICINNSYLNILKLKIDLPYIILIKKYASQFTFQSIAEYTGSSPRFTTEKYNCPEAENGCYVKAFVKPPRICEDDSVPYGLTLTEIQ